MNTRAPVELLPCPFCGGKAVDRREIDGFPMVYCDGGECFGPQTTASTFEDALVQWNIRATVVSSQAGERRASIARIIDPALFERFDRVAAQGRTATNGRRWEEVCYREAIDRTLAKADDILALTPAPGGMDYLADEHQIIEGREDWFLLAHDLDEARNAYLNGFGKQGNAERKQRLEQLLWNDKGTFAQALRIASLRTAAQSTKPLGDLAATVRDAIDALERNSTSAPVVECLKAALARTAAQSAEVRERTIAIPEQLPGEIACILEDCDPPQNQSPEAVAALVKNYQPTWDRIIFAIRALA